MIGRSPAMVKTYKLIAHAARMDATVLITGESGAGKELAARAIHDFSVRRDKPFIAINCSGLTDTLLEAELFGHSKGSFTGATAERLLRARRFRPACCACCSRVRCGASAPRTSGA